MGTDGQGWGIVLSMVAFVAIIILVIVFPLQSMILWIVGSLGFAIRTIILGFMDGFK